MVWPPQQADTDLAVEAPLFLFKGIFVALFRTQL